MELISESLAFADSIRASRPTYLGFCIEYDRMFRLLDHKSKGVP
jgi:hypothetical protein